MKQKTSESLLKTIFQYASDAIVILDENGVIAGANPSMERLTGYCTDELIQKVNLCDICHGMNKCADFTACINCFTTLESISSFEIRLLHKNGHIFSAAASTTRLPQHVGAFLIVVLRDMSEHNKQEQKHVQKKMANYMIQAQEEERKRVSRELHDGVGQTIYSMIVGLNIIEQMELEDDLKGHFQLVRDMAVQALDEVRHIAVDLRPSSLDDWGLVPALRSYIKQFERTYGIVTNLSVVGQERRYGSSIETALYRICQEAMINAAKYANTDTLEIRFEEKDQLLYLVVTDLGRGFNLEKIEVLGTGLGLYGMRERAKLIGGTLDITSRADCGTTIRVYVPLDKEEERAYDHSCSNS
ncbi:MAG: sensor signal transduction histidine kinase [Pelosinus sp.]|nr:sensor signal transduction histidine kinase [Pelosinus sp.]